MLTKCEGSQDMCIWPVIVQKERCHLRPPLKMSTSNKKTTNRSHDLAGLLPTDPLVVSWNRISYKSLTSPPNKIILNHSAKEPGATLMDLPINLCPWWINLMNHVHPFSSRKWPENGATDRNNVSFLVGGELICLPVDLGHAQVLA